MRKPIILSAKKEGGLVDYLSPIPQSRRCEEFRLLAKFGLVASNYLDNVVDSNKIPTFSKSDNVSLNLILHKDADGTLIEWLYRQDCNTREFAKKLIELANNGLLLMKGDIKLTSVDSEDSNIKNAPYIEQEDTLDEDTELDFDNTDIVGMFL